MDLQEVFKNFSKNSKDLESKFKHLPLFHSDFQLEAFVLFKDCVDEYGVYKKARNELEHRFNTLEDLHLEYERLTLEVEIINEKKENSKQILEVKKFDLDLKEVQIKLKRLHRSVSELSREFDLILGVFSNYYEAFKDKKINDLELEYWLKKYINLCIARIKKGDNNWQNELEGFAPQFKKIVVEHINSARDKQLAEAEEAEALLEGTQNA